MVLENYLYMNPSAQLVALYSKTQINIILEVCVCVCVCVCVFINANKIDRHIDS
jgi:hypothetical protein